jgi:major histocompatibility complex class I
VSKKDQLCGIRRVRTFAGVYIDSEKKKKKKSQAVVVHTFNPSTWEAEAGGFLSSRLAWSTK